ncbi:MAG: CopG family transcriptional regulator [Proteobacteria bacterium]|nr:CopG family transcriptional regulator [Pseudomonadota bacterium]
MMHRTQIYLSDEETDVLDRLAQEQHRTRSELIRAALQRAYLAGHGADEVLVGLQAAAGGWRRRRSGRVLVESLRKGRLSRLHDAASGPVMKRDR